MSCSEALVRASAVHGTEQAFDWCITDTAFKPCHYQKALVPDSVNSWGFLNLVETDIRNKATNLKNIKACGNTWDTYGMIYKWSCVLYLAVTGLLHTLMHSCRLQAWWREGVSASRALTDLITLLQNSEVTYITRIYPNPIPSYTKVDKKENSVSTLSTWQCNSTYFFLFDKNSVTTDSSHNGFCLCSKTHHLILALQVQQRLADITSKKGCQT